MNIWIVFVLGGLVTYLIRLSFIMIIGRRPVPPQISRSLRFIPAAVLTAIIFPEIFLDQGRLNISMGNARLLAGIIAAIVAWRTRSVVLTFLIGMLSLWIIQWYLNS